MKRKTLVFSALLVVLAFVGACATLNIGLDSKEKKFLLVQKEVNSALRDYKTFLLSQPAEDQVKLHEAYDAPIKAMSAALDAWEQVVKGIVLDSGQMQEFLRIKNELILAGWSFFAKEGGD